VKRGGRAKAGITLRYRAILAYVGAILSLAACLMLVPLVTLAAWPEERSQAIPFLLPGLTLGALGLGLWRRLRPRGRVILSVGDAGLIVVFSWIVVCIVSAWPLMMAQGLTFTHALFESVSGWSTTGLSVVDVTAASHAVLLWRSVMQLAGGAGLAIIMLASLAGPTGPGLSVAEGRSEQLVPHVRQSAKLVLTIYAIYAGGGAVALCLAGMGPFDALNHSFAAVSTGGFSTRAESIGYWDSPAVEAVIVVLMVAGNLNYLTALLLFQGKVRAVLRNGEVRTAAALFIVCGAAMLLSLSSMQTSPTTEGLRLSCFETASALTTTGFTTTSYAGWPALALLALIVLMLIGGGTCSTAGGMKQYRIYLLWRALGWHVRRAFLPRTAVVENYIWQGERKDYVSDSRISAVAVFVVLFLSAYVLGTAFLSAFGYGLEEALFEFASAMGTVGLSVGVTSAATPAPVLWAQILAMFMGRLEFLIVVISVGKVVRDLLVLAR